MTTPTPRTDKMSESLLSKTFLTSYVTMQELARALERELATERARLDWVFHNCKVTSDDFTVHDREDLGVAMKEGAK